MLLVCNPYPSPNKLLFILFCRPSSELKEAMAQSIVMAFPCLRAPGGTGYVSKQCKNFISRILMWKEKSLSIFTFQTNLSLPVVSELLCHYDADFYLLQHPFSNMFNVLRSCSLDGQTYENVITRMITRSSQYVYIYRGMHHLWLANQLNQLWVRLTSANSGHQFS